MAEAREGHPTVVVARRVRAGREADFARWAEGFVAVVRAQAGCLDCRQVPPMGRAQPEWVFVSTFETARQLKAWIESPLREAWLGRAEPLVEGRSQAQVISGLEQLFGLLPPDVAPPPPVWKVAVSVFAGLFPLSLLNLGLVGPRIACWPLPLRALVSALLMVGLMTWVVMPLVTRMLKPWLYPSARR